MENANHALLIAGAVLLAMMVASLGVFFSRKMATSTSRMYRELEEVRRTEFNQQFLKFDNGKQDKTIHDIVTIINLAKDSNIANGLSDMTPPTNPAVDKTRYVKVDFINGGYSLGALGAAYNLQNLTNQEVNNLIKDEMIKEPITTIFECIVHINENTGYVNYIEIK